MTRPGGWRPTGQSFVKARTGGPNLRNDLPRTRPARRPRKAQDPPPSGRSYGEDPWPTEPPTPDADNPWLRP